MGSPLAAVGTEMSLYPPGETSLTLSQPPGTSSSHCPPIQQHMAPVSLTSKASWFVLCKGIILG